LLELSWFTSNNFSIDTIVFGMRTRKTNLYDLRHVKNFCNHPEMISTQVENSSPTFQNTHGLKTSFDIVRGTPLRTLHVL